MLANGRFDTIVLLLLMLYVVHLLHVLFVFVFVFLFVLFVCLFAHFFTTLYILVSKLTSGQLPSPFCPNPASQSRMTGLSGGSLASSPGTIMASG